MVDFEMLEVILESLKAILFLVIFIFIMKLSKKLYGGRFTSVIPLITAGCGLFFVQGVLALGTELFFEEIRHAEGFVHGLQILQLTAGVLFASAFYQLYKITYATTGFFGEEEKPVRGKTK